MQPSYAPTLAELDGEIEPLLKDLAVYDGDQPPPDYSLDSEVRALRETVDAAGLERFHLVGFSGGGAVSLAFAAAHPERLLSVALFEPADVPGAWDPDEAAWWESFTDGLADLPPDEMTEEFTKRHLRQGIVPPSLNKPPPPWMSKRPAGLNAMMRAFKEDRSERARLRQVHAPVYLAYGLQTADFMVHRVQILAGLLPDLWIEAYEGLHHFAPPQRSQPKRYAAALRALWARADERVMQSPPDGDTTYAA